MSRARDIANFTLTDSRVVASNVTQHEGSIDALASNPTVTLGSNATFPAGMIVYAQIIPNSNKTTISSTSSSDVELIFWGNYNKLFGGTDLFMQFNIFMWDSSTQWTGNIGVKYGSGSTYWAQSYPYEDVSKGNQMTVYAKISGHTTTGSQGISIRYGCPTSNTRPASIINPNSAEDSRLNNLGQSVGIIYEVNT